MATKAIVRCKNCSEEFPIYWNTTNHDPICCPNCFLELNQDLSEKVLKAMAVVHDLNHEICKEHLEYNGSLFEVSIYHNTYPNLD